MPNSPATLATTSNIVNLSSTKFLLGCLAASGAILALGLTGVWKPTPWLLAGEVFATIIALFVLGSIRYRLHKNALTYGAAMVIVTTFAMAGTVETSAFHREIADQGWGHFIQHNIFPSTASTN